jgi:5'-deoxynucleotidase YfbR-like HD superfamily hydrolase
MSTALLEAMKEAIAASEVMQGPEKVERIPSRITTYSGRHIDPLDLQPEDIDLEDIAHHLSMQCRWSGATRYHYSVAQHTYLASYLVPPDEAYDALHHDDAEYALQDMAKPLKNHMTLGKAYRGAEQRIERVIGPHLDVRFPVTENTKAADLLMLCAEADQLIHGRQHWTYYQDFPAADIDIKKWTPERAKKMWLARHALLRRDK